jgi:hypothetical protein
MSKLEPLPGYPRWEMWSVRIFETNSLTWCARPIDAPMAVAHADSVSGLAVAVGEWLDRPQREIDDTVATLRRELDSIPEKYVHQRRHIESRINAELVAIRTHTSTLL